MAITERYQYGWQGQFQSAEVEENIIKQTQYY